MYNVENLKKRFTQAGLTLEIASKPFSVGRGADDIFGLDIIRKFKGNVRGEIFRMWPGNKDNVIQVMDVNKELGQLVLAVKEEKREIVAEMRSWDAARIRRVGLEKWFARHPEQRGRIFIKKGVVYETGETSASKRYFLLGMDERQMFIATLPRSVTTVKQAHESLKSTRLTTADGAARGRTVRQGEWFFVHPSDQELKDIREQLKKNTIFIQKKATVQEAGRGRGGKPHIADELVRMPGSVLEHGHRVRPRDEIYVRGSIRHPDHKTIKFSTWRKVFLNNEGSTSTAIGGGSWID